MPYPPLPELEPARSDNESHLAWHSEEDYNGESITSSVWDALNIAYFKYKKEVKEKVECLYCEKVITKSRKYMIKGRWVCASCRDVYLIVERNKTKWKERTLSSYLHILADAIYGIHCRICKHFNKENLRRCGRNYGTGLDSSGVHRSYVFSYANHGCSGYIPKVIEKRKV